MSLLTQLAHEVLKMDEELQALRYENMRLREKSKEFDDYVQQSLQHGQQMMGNWLKVLTDPNSPIVMGLDAKERRDKQGG